MKWITQVQASAPNLELAEPVKVTFKGGTQTLDLQLRVILAPEKVTVDENGAPRVSTDANSNASAQVVAPRNTVWESIQQLT